MFTWLAYASLDSSQRYYPLPAIGDPLSMPCLSPRPPLADGLVTGVPTGLILTFGRGLKTLSYSASGEKSCSLGVMSLRLVSALTP